MYQYKVMISDIYITSILKFWKVSTLGSEVTHHPHFYSDIIIHATSIFMFCCRYINMYTDIILTVPQVVMWTMHITPIRMLLWLFRISFIRRWTLKASLKASQNFKEDSVKLCRIFFESQNNNETQKKKVRIIEWCLVPGTKRHSIILTFFFNPPS